MGIMLLASIGFSIIANQYVLFSFIKNAESPAIAGDSDYNNRLEKEKINTNN